MIFFYFLFKKNIQKNNTRIFLFLKILNLSETMYYSKSPLV